MKWLFLILLIAALVAGSVLVYFEQSDELVSEQGSEAVSDPDEEEVEQFTATGNLVRNNPGLEPDVWYVVYEAPGAPALTKPLRFSASSVCTDSVTSDPCTVDNLEPGMRVHIQGHVTAQDVVQVMRLELK